MKRKLTILLLLALALPKLHAQQFESAKEAVANMCIGWNLGNTLDSNSGSTTNMWIERWSSRTPKDYETAWGQPQATRALIHMFKEAGFKAIRVPVTWYPHYGTMNSVGLNWDQSKWTGYTLEAAWLKRVKEVVDYVIDEGMYCILNVHHDTGTGTTAWIRADKANYDKYKDRYEKLWTALANEFKSYDKHLLFEGYNEMTDKFDSWCFASFNSTAKYDATEAKAAYDAVNSYAQSFVKAVRATGGNNAERNLIVNTYACCDGHGTWNSHLLDPLKQMAKPEDSVEGHLAVQIHSYWDALNFGASLKSEITTSMTNLKNYIANRLGVPVIIGEWGNSNESLKYSTPAHRTKICDFAKYYVQQAKKQGFATFYWMGLSDGSDRSTPQWTEPELLESIVKGYYGDGGYVDGIKEVTSNSATSSNRYTLSGRVASPTHRGIVIKNGKLILKK